MKFCYAASSSMLNILRSRSLSLKRAKHSKRLVIFTCVPQLKTGIKRNVMKGFISTSNSLSIPVLVLSALWLGGCATAMTTVTPDSAVATGLEQTVPSEIEGQLNDGGWVMNTPGQAHVHKVVLAECPAQPVVTRHVHNHLQAAQVGASPHKHRGCYICPPKNSLVKRILSH